MCPESSLIAIKRREAVHCALPHMRLATRTAGIAPPATDNLQSGVAPKECTPFLALSSPCPAHMSLTLNSQNLHRPRSSLSAFTACPSTLLLFRHSETATHRIQCNACLRSCFYTHSFLPLHQPINYNMNLHTQAKGSLLDHLQQLT